MANVVADFNAKLLDELVMLAEQTIEDEEDKMSFKSKYKLFMNEKKLAAATGLLTTQLEAVLSFHSQKCSFPPVSPYPRL